MDDIRQYTFGLQGLCGRGSLQGLSVLFGVWRVGAQGSGPGLRIKGPSPLSRATTAAEPI